MPSSDTELQFRFRCSNPTPSFRSGNTRYSVLCRSSHSIVHNAQASCTAFESAHFFERRFSQLEQPAAFPGTAKVPVRSRVQKYVTWSERYDCQISSVEIFLPARML